MKITLISGSHRENSQSSKVSRYIEKILKDQLLLTTDVIDLKNNPLPLWDESHWQKNSESQKRFAPYSEKLATSDGFVVISPEWGGMVPPALHNLFLLSGNHELSHKPALIVGVSASRGGSYPVAELRMSSYKNSYICYLPEHIIVRNVNDVLNGDSPVSDEDTYIRDRIFYSLKLLKEYTAAFQPIRKNFEFDYKKYGFGM